MGLADILILILLMMSFMVGFSGFYGTLSSNADYNVTNVTNFSSFNRIKNVTSKVNVISNTFKNATNNTMPAIVMVFYAPYQYIVGAVEAGLLVFDAPYMIHDMITDVSINALGIPQWIIDTVDTIVLIVVVFAIIFFIVGKK